MSCGEYGNNIKNLVNAIKNGKRDVRRGYSFADEKEALNNSLAVSEIPKDTEIGAKITEIKDKNDANNIEDKFQDRKTNESNGMIPNYASNDIAKQSTFYNYTICIYKKKILFSTKVINHTSFFFCFVYKFFSSFFSKYHMLVFNIFLLP